MLPSDRFTTMQTQTQQLVQQNCPVRVYCFRQILEQQTGVVFLQLRLVNCSKQTVQAVFLHAETLRSPSLMLAGCGAQPQSVFGEERMLFLGDTVQTLPWILVDCVLFSDGTSWHRDSAAEQRPSNVPIVPPAVIATPPPEQHSPAPERQKERSLPPLAHPAMLRPAPSSERPRGPSAAARVLSLLLYILGALALIGGLILGIFCLRRLSIHLFSIFL